jgi:hypothetical protein
MERVRPNVVPGQLVQQVAGTFIAASGMAVLQTLVQGNPHAEPWFVWSKVATRHSSVAARAWCYYVPTRRISLGDQCARCRGAGGSEPCKRLTAGRRCSRGHLWRGIAYQQTATRDWRDHSSGPSVPMQRHYRRTLRLQHCQCPPVQSPPSRHSQFGVEHLARQRVADTILSRLRHFAQQPAPYQLV